MNSSFLCSSAASERRIIRVDKEEHDVLFCIYRHTPKHLPHFRYLWKFSCGSYFSWPLRYILLYPLYIHIIEVVQGLEPLGLQPRILTETEWNVLIVAAEFSPWCHAWEFAELRAPGEHLDHVPARKGEVPKSSSRSARGWDPSTELLCSQYKSIMNESSATYFNLKCKRLDHMTLLPVMIMWSISLFPIFINKCEDNTAMPRWSLMSVQNAEKMRMHRGDCSNPTYVSDAGLDSIPIFRDVDWKRL